MPPILSRKLSRNDRSVDVLVVGASPVGLCHALWLAQQNLHVAVIDSRAPGGIRDEWLLLEPEALALLDSLQILAKLTGAMVAVRRINIKTPSLPPSELMVDQLKLSHPYIGIIRRSDLEEACERQAEELGVHVHMEHRLRALDIQDGPCRAIVERLTRVSQGYAATRMESTVEGSEEFVANWVIGADGRRSSVRRDLGASFKPLAEPRINVVVEFSAAEDLGEDAQLIVGADRTDTLWPLGNNRYLWVGEPQIEEMRGVTIDQQLALSLDAIQLGSVEDSLPARALEPLNIQPEHIISKHALRYLPAHAVPSGRGRVWLTGSAAQLVGPVLGADENLGFREVKDLALLLGLGSDGAHQAPLLTPELYARRRSLLQLEALGSGGYNEQWRRQHGYSARQAEQALGSLPLFGRTRESLFGSRSTPSERAWIPAEHETT